MSNGHGGARPGAGRKPKTERYAIEIESATDKVYVRLDDNVNSLQALADNDRIVVHQEWAPAGTVTIKSYEVDAEGKVHRVEKPAFPDLDPEHMVLVKRREVNNGPSETALTYLIDQGLGKATQHIESIAKNIDLSKLSTEQLERLAAGDDLLSVILGG